MDKCPKCGNKLSSIDVLCPKCGALVEVVQIKKGTASQNAAAVLSTPMKKLPQQNLIVYNDDWPTDDMEFSSDEKTTGESIKMPAVSEANEVSELLKEFGAPATPEPNPHSFDKTYPSESELGSEENYLAIFRHMKLPELEDINTGTAGQTEDPFMHDAHSDYAAQADQSSKQAEELVDQHSKSAADPAQHHWLELEELSGNVLPEPIPAIEAEPVSALSENAAIDEGTEPLTASEPAPTDEPRFRYRTERRQATTVLHPRRSAGRVVMMIFVWLLVTAALFCGFFFLDQYVTENYGSYPAMLYEWSNGNINLAPSDVPSPTPLEAPAP